MEADSRLWDAGDGLEWRVLVGSGSAGRAEVEAGGMNCDPCGILCMLGIGEGESPRPRSSVGHIRVWKTGLAHDGSARLLYDTSPLYVDYGSQI